MHQEYFEERGLKFKNFDEGFVAYHLNSESKTPHASLSALHLRKEHRGPHAYELLSKMVDELAEEVKKENINFLVGTVNLQDKNRQHDLVHLLQLGFELNNADTQKLVLFKKV